MARAGLTRASVTREAAARANEVGLDRLVLGDLARDLGVTMPALYKHVRGIDDLRREIALQAAVEVRLVLAEAAAGLSSGDALAAICIAYRRWAQANPGRYSALQAAPEPGDLELTSAASELLALFDSVLAGYRLLGDDATDAVRMIRSLLHGFIELEAVGGFRMARPADATFARMIDSLDAELHRWSALA